VRTARVACAIVVLGATVVGAAWLATDRVDVLMASRRRTDDLAYPITFSQVDVPAWWGAYAAVILLIVGLGFGLRVLGKRLRPARRTGALLSLPAPAFPDPRALLRRVGRDVLGGLDWLVAEPLRLLVKR
jgi:hypothetical protein